ncbi:MAG: rRNA pseudouridine synthase, partial [Clostridia bacterium]|nr:rRNA pseudouridine synthase [Clostridia bacterium]
MRLDKFLTVTGTASRSESAKMIRRGGVLVDGRVANSPSMQIAPDHAVVEYGGEPVVYRQYTYIMMNKPQGVVSATEDGRDKTVLDLLPDKLKRLNLFPCGRLDKNTVGLMLLTDNGELSHRLLAPKSHVAKSYRFLAEKPISDEHRAALESGVYIAGGYLTKPARLALDEGRMSGVITITEGKYHQIKLMLEAVDNKILSLGRITFGP